MKDKPLKKYKLFGQVRSTHLADSIRVDTHEGNKPFGRLTESIMFEIEKVVDQTITFRIWHLVYDKNGAGYYCDDQGDVLTIDLSKHFNDEDKVKLIRKGCRNG